MAPKSCQEKTFRKTAPQQKATGELAAKLATKCRIVIEIVGTLGVLCSLTLSQGLVFAFEVSIFFRFSIPAAGQSKGYMVL